MPARTKPGRDLAVTFVREGEPPETTICNGGRSALAAGLKMLGKRYPGLRPGDQLSVTYADEDPPLPEPSRSSHYS